MRVGMALLLAIMMLVAPATSVLAQPDALPSENTSNDDDGSGDDVVIVQETEDHLVAVIQLPATAFDPEHEVQYKAPVGEAGLTGSEDGGSYTVQLTVSPKQLEGGEISLGKKVWDVSAILEDHPESPLPSLTERANDTLQAQLDELFGQVNQLYRDVENLEQEVDRLAELRQDTESTAREEPLVNGTLTVTEFYLNMSATLLASSIENLNKTLDKAPTEEMIERAKVAHTLFRLAFVSLYHAREEVEDSKIQIGGGVTGPVEENLSALMNDTSSFFFDTWNETLVPTLMEWQGFAFNGTRNVTGLPFGAINGVLYGGDCDEADEQDDPECPTPCEEDPEKDCPAPLDRQVQLLLLDLLGGAQENLTREERKVIDTMEAFSVPPLGDELPNDVDYASLRSDLANLTRNATPGERFDNWTVSQANKTVDEMQIAADYLLWLLDLWVGNVDELEPEAAGNTARMLYSAHAQLNSTWQTLNHTFWPPEESCEEDPDQECPEPSDPPEKNPWERTWADFNASYEAARNASENLTEMATNMTLVKEVWDQHVRDLAKPTQVRVLIPKDLKGPDGGKNLPGTPQDIDDEVEDSVDDGEVPYYGEPPSTDTCPDEDLCPEKSGTDGLLDDGGETDSTSDDGTSDDGGDDASDSDTSDDGSDTSNDGGGDDGSDTGSDGDGADGDSQGTDGSDAGGDGGSDDTGQSSGTSAGSPSVSVDPGELRVSEGEQTVTYLRLRNTGDSEETYQLTVERDAPITVDAPSDSESTLGPGESVDLRVRMTPTGTGDGSVTFHVTGSESSATKTLPVSVGEAPGGEKALKVTLSPWFMQLNTGSTGTIQVDLANVADRPRTVDLSTWTHGPAEASVDGPASVRIAPGGEKTVTLAVTPQDSGPAEVNLRATSDLGDELKLVTLLSMAGDVVDAGQDDDQGADSANEDQPEQEEERGLPLPGVISLIALGLAALRRRRRKR